MHFGDFWCEQTHIECPVALAPVEPPLRKSRILADGSVAPKENHGLVGRCRFSVGFSDLVGVY